MSCENKKESEHEDKFTTKQLTEVKNLRHMEKCKCMKEIAGKIREK